MTTVSYDQAVPYYDLTRGYPEGIAQQIRDTILQLTEATTSTRFVELGIGTGLIGIPFIQAGYDYWGVDISIEMMKQIGNKLTDKSLHPKLAQANITHSLTFPDHTFDVINAIRIFHLLDDVPNAIREAKRILKRGGYFVMGRDVSNSAKEAVDPFNVAHAKWDDILEGLGIVPGSIRPGLWLSAADIITMLEDEGATVDEVDLLHYNHNPLTVRTIADRHKQRMYSRDWELSDDIHAEAVQQLEQWLDTDYPHPDKPYAKPMIFRAIVSRWNI